MANQKPLGSEEVTQLFPGKKQVSLKGLYLDQKLAGLAGTIGRPLVIADYITDKNGLVAIKSDSGRWRVPPEIKNSSDWRLFQELLAQADLAISSSAYLKGVAASGKPSQDILFQFEPGGEYEELGDWRLSAGFKNRSPDLAFLTHHLDFKFPVGLLGGGRRIFIFTTDAVANSDAAAPFRAAGVEVVGSGETGVDGDRLIEYLQAGLGYHVIMLTTGPSVLDLLLHSNHLDLLYISEAQMEIPFEDPATVRTILSAGIKPNELEDFVLTHKVLQENVRTDVGSFISQVFLRFDRKGLLSN